MVFGLEDSGTGDSTVTYEAYPGETPVFSSGQEIKGWEKVAAALPGLPPAARGNVWVANVSDRFFTLYDETKGCCPVRGPAGFIPPRTADAMCFISHRAIEELVERHDVEIVVRPHHAWIVNVLPLASVDVESNWFAHPSMPPTR